MSRVARAILCLMLLCAGLAMPVHASSPPGISIYVDLMGAKGLPVHTARMGKRYSLHVELADFTGRDIPSPWTLIISSPEIAVGWHEPPMWHRYPDLPGVTDMTPGFALHDHQLVIYQSPATMFMAGNATVTALVFASHGEWGSYLGQATWKGRIEK